MSVKVPPGGTRGTPFPRLPGWLARLTSRMQLRRFRRRGGYTKGGVDALVLETTGAKTGEARTAMLGYVEESEESWLVIASLAGAARHPAWLHNLASHPAATIEFGDGRRIQIRAETLDGVDLESAWRQIAVAAPEYVKYRSKTDRQIPVIRLRRR